MKLNAQSMYCGDIQDWLDQFGRPNDRALAEVLLRRLQFVPREELESWIANTIDKLEYTRPVGIYAVRKRLPSNTLWNTDGSIAARPGDTLGSEELIQHSIGSAVRRKPSRFLDHPGLQQLKEKRIQTLVLVDDTIGSGDRACSFLSAMFANSTFKSWWSYGLIRIHLVSFVRNRDAEGVIVSYLPGFGSRRRLGSVEKYISFKSSLVLTKSGRETRWGLRYIEIKGLCERETRIKKKYRLGWGDTMSNIVFEHSIPNNIPGILHKSNGQWKALFPGRVMPLWMVNLLKSKNMDIDKSDKLRADVVTVLQLIKSGYKQSKSIAIQMEREVEIVNSLVYAAQAAGLLKGRVLTKAGYELIFGLDKKLQLWDQSMYIPTSWRVG